MANNAPIRGFTLIEMSIVIVIIGFIVGGILVGQDLINAARIRSQISQIQQYVTATNTFNLKYGGLPGDLPLKLATQDGFDITDSCEGGISGNFGSPPYDPNGIVRNGDGLIGTLENNAFYLDISQAGMINYSITPATFTAAGISDPCLGKSYLSAPAVIAGNVLDIGYTDSNYSWFLINAGAIFEGNSSIVAITPAQAYAIDAKMDDGSPITGNVRAEVYVVGGGGGIWNSLDAYWSAPTDGIATVGAPFTTCFNTTNYNYSMTYQNGGVPSCMLSVKLQ